MSNKFCINPCSGKKQKRVCPPTNGSNIDPLYNSKLVFSFKDIHEKAISHVSCEHGKFILEMLKTLSQKTLNDVFENQGEFEYHIFELQNSRKSKSKDLNLVKNVVPVGKTKIHRIGWRNKDQDNNRRIIFDIDENSLNILTIYHVAKQHYD